MQVLAPPGPVHSSHSSQSLSFMHDAPMTFCATVPTFLLRRRSRSLLLPSFGATAEGDEECGGVGHEAAKERAKHGY